MIADLHIHPLDHKYYFNMADGFDKVVLDDSDKQAICDIVDWCCLERGLDAIALTDHDMIQTSLYAKQYAQSKSLPIEIITGAECSVFDPHSVNYYSEVHLLCLGIEELPKYDSQTPVDKMIDAVRDLGAYVIMSHPVYYPDSFLRYCHLLDGYEYRNGDNRPFDEGKKYVESQGLMIRAFDNSDYHYRGELIDINSPCLQHNYYENHVFSPVVKR